MLYIKEYSGNDTGQFTPLIGGCDHVDPEELTHNGRCGFVVKLSLPGRLDSYNVWNILM